MKLVKNGKILFTLILTLVVSVIVAFSAMTYSPALAEDATLKASDYFKIENGNMELTEDGLKLEMENGGVLTKSKLAIKSLGVTLTLGENVDGVKIIAKGTSKYALGVKDDGGDLTTSVSSVIEINKKDGKISMNDGDEVNYSAPATAFEVVMTDANNGYVGEAANAVSSKTLYNYEQKTYHGDISLIDLQIEVTVASGANSGVVTVSSVSTNVADSAYAQNLAVNAEKTAFVQAASAKSIVIFPSDKFAVDSANGNIIAESGHTYDDFKANAYSVLGGDEKVTFEVNANNVTYGASDDYIIFNVAGEEELICKIDEADAGSFKVTVVDDGDGVAPVYKELKVADIKNVNNPAAVARANFINAFLAKLVNKGTYTYDMTTDTYSISDDAEFVPLGSSKYLTLPTFEDMVSDNTTSYSSLKYTVHYRNHDTSSTYTTKLRVPLAVAGDYTFYVAFSDTDGAAMEKKDFYEIKDEDDSNLDVPNVNGYAAYIFSFTVKDNAPIVVNNVCEQVEGFIGTKYTASAFEVTASSYNEEYTLKYCKTNSADESDWVVIPKASKITDKKYDQDGFTYGDVKEIAYDGKLTFTPDRAGYYKITCRVESDVSGRYDEETTNVIEVLKSPTIVKPDSKWLQNNVWSVVFLSIGTLCLIGIVVLLFIKPKEKTTEED